jgi:hypothetical protein
LLPPEAQRRFILEHPDLARRLNSERAVMGIQLFAALAPEAREKVLTGERLYTRLPDLPAVGQNLIRRRWREQKALNPDSPTFAGDPPEQIIIHSRTFGPNLCPMVFISAGVLGGHHLFRRRGPGGAGAIG